MLGLPSTTVSVAGLLVIEPVESVTSTSYAPASPGPTGSMVNEGCVAPAIGWPSLRHW